MYVMLMQLPIFSTGFEGFEELWRYVDMACKLGVLLTLTINTHYYHILAMTFEILEEQI